MRIWNFSLVLIVMSLLLSCQNKEEKYYPKDLDYIEIPLDPYEIQPRYKVAFSVNGDSIYGIFDTGSDISLVATNKSIVPDKVDSIRLANGKIIPIQLNVVKEFSWGKLRLKDKLIWLYSNKKNPYLSNLLGREVLKGSIVQIDHYNHCIKLTTNAKKIEAKGIAIPCRFDFKDTIYIKAKIAGKELEFLLDTGYSGAFLLKGSTYQSLNFQTPIIWKDKSNNGNKYNLADISIGDKTFQNCRIQEDLLCPHPLLGATFLRRFKTITIDYINKQLYLELPQDIEATKDISLKFSSDTIKPVSLQELSQFYKVFNSFDFQLDSLGDLYEVSSLALLENKDFPLSLGDTIIGVNQILFTDSYNSQIKNAKQYRLVKDKEKNLKTIDNIINKDSQASFHYLKNGKVHHSVFHRRKYLTNPPQFGYSYSKDRYLIMSVGLKFYCSNGKEAFNIHIPWKNLINKEYSIPIDSIHSRNNVWSH